MKTRRMMVMEKMKMKTKVKDDDEDVLFYQLFDLAVGVQSAGRNAAPEWRRDRYRGQAIK